MASSPAEVALPRGAHRCTDARAAAAKRMTVTLSTAELEAARRRGFGVAHRMLGNVSDAEDVAQEAVLRLAAADEPIHQPAAWITIAATRLSIDVLRSARARRETCVGPWLPEPPRSRPIAWCRTRSDGIAAGSGRDEAV
jgi:DNA-directed RNA polymerase specialized sigma24 family protein